MKPLGDCQCGVETFRTEINCVAASWAATVTRKDLQKGFRRAVEHLECPDCFPKPFYEATAFGLALTLQQRTTK